jgi:hypothetical protein
MRQPRRESWSFAAIVPAAAAVGFALIISTPVSGWGYLVGPMLAAMATFAAARLVDEVARTSALAFASLLAAVVTLIVMALLAVLSVLIFGL